MRPYDDERWSPETQRAIDLALLGLSADAQDAVSQVLRVMRAELRKRYDAELEKAWNNYLVLNSPTMLRDGHFLELCGIWIFILDHRAVIHHGRVQRAVRDELGAEGEKTYHEAVAKFTSRISEKTPGRVGSRRRQGSLAAAMSAVCEDVRTMGGLL